MKTNTDLFLKVLNIISWIIFVGLCIDTGGYISNTIMTLTLNQKIASDFWSGINLSYLLHFNLLYFLVIALILSLVSLLKSILFYLIISIFHENKLNFESPFDKQLGKYLNIFAWISLCIGLILYTASNFYKWLVKLGVEMPELSQMKFEANDIWLFMGIILLIFAKIFKKGIELQSDKDLTI